MAAQFKWRTPGFAITPFARRAEQEPEVSVPTVSASLSISARQVSGPVPAYMAIRFWTTLVDLSHHALRTAHRAALRSPTTRYWLLTTGEAARLVSRPMRELQAPPSRRS